MNRSPLAPLLAASGWTAFATVLTPLLLPSDRAYRTVAVGGALLLFTLALVGRRASFVLGVVAICAGGFSALLFGAPEPAMIGPILAAGLFAGAAVREVYEVGNADTAPILVPAFRAWAATAAVSALAALAGARTGYFLLRGVPPPRSVNVLGEDAAHTAVGILAALAALLLASGMHRLAARLSRTSEGRAAIDAALVLSALVAGSVALLQKLSVIPAWRADRWAEWGRSQSVFTDPSAAGVAVALLIAPLMARAAGTGNRVLRVAAGFGIALALVLLPDSGSRAGLIGTLTAATVFVIWAATRTAAGVRPGLRHRVISVVGGLTLVAALAFAASVSWPSRGAARSAILARLEASLERSPTPAEKTAERALLYEGAWAMFREHPVVGIGLGSFRAEFPNTAVEELLRPVQWTDHPPSLYLGTLAECGFAGAAVLALLLAGILRGVGRALTFHEVQPEEALRAAGAAAAIVGMCVVFLFGSHLVYPEIAILFGVLTARVPLAIEGRTARLLTGTMPVVLAAALVLSAGGVLARLYETRLPEIGFEYSDSGGVYAAELEPDGRPFRWTAPAAAWRVGGPPGPTPSPRFRRAPSTLTLPVKNARPDGRAVRVDVFWDDVELGGVTLPNGGWRLLEMPVNGPGVLRLSVAEPFRPPSRGDRRRLGIETGLAPVLRPR